MRNYLADRAGVNPVREFFLLWVLGQDLPGAIKIKPADGEKLPPTVKINKTPTFNLSYLKSILVCDIFAIGSTLIVERAVIS